MRPLKRAIQRNLENPLAARMLAAAFVAGDVIEIDVVADANGCGAELLTFRKAEPVKV